MSISPTTPTNSEVSAVDYKQQFSDGLSVFGILEGQNESALWAQCENDPAFFINHYCFIYDPELSDWIAFDLWLAQAETLEKIHIHQLTVALKARQLGMTWLCLAYALWQAIFKPIANGLIFSKRDDEAVYLLSEERLFGMYRRLPAWMRKRVAVDNKGAHLLRFSNGSSIRAFPTSAGDSYTATFALVDEADLVPDLGQMMGRIRPTIDAGGKLILLSRVDKTKPNSVFKRIYKSAKVGGNGFCPVFLPWGSRPDRDQAWYDGQVRDSLENTGALDYVHEQYPATDAEALAPATLDKRLPPNWLQGCLQEQPKLLDNLPPALDGIAGLDVYRLVEPNKHYVIGADCAEGLPNSDNSTTYVLTYDTTEVVARLVGKLTPAIHADLTRKLSDYYHQAPILPENNNHGHAFILWFDERGLSSRIVKGHDKKAGWTSSTKGKIMLYDRLAEVVRRGNCIIRDIETFAELASIEMGTLRAPDGELDDMADAFALAVQLASQPPPPPAGPLGRVMGTKYKSSRYDKYRGR